MQLLLSLVFFASIAGFSRGDEGFDCYRNCSTQLMKHKEWQDTAFLSICKLVLPGDHIPTPCNVTTDSPLGCYQNCAKNNLTNVHDEARGILTEYCAKDDYSLDALRANVRAFCTNWDARVRDNNCTKLEGCDKTACTFDNAVNDIAYAYSTDSVKYATSYVKLLVGTLPEQDGLPVDKGCDIIYRPGNAAYGLHATGVVLALTFMASLIHAL